LRVAFLVFGKVLVFFLSDIVVVDIVVVGTIFVEVVVVGTALVDY
jgi:hypothetical protein